MSKSKKVRVNTYSDSDGTALSRLLAGQGVRSTEVGTPVTSSDGDDAQLGNDDGGTDSGSDFLGGLDSETDVTLGVTNDDDGLESGSLTGTGLLLDGLDLYGRENTGQHVILPQFVVHLPPTVPICTVTELFVRLSAIRNEETMSVRGYISFAPS